jgi:ABC-type spermidine/putrescine transport system permease subunit II
MLRNLTFNSILWIVLGLGCFIAGSYYGWQYRRAITSIIYFSLIFGLLVTGLAMILCGLTNGFTDQTPWGRRFRKIGALAFIGGLPMLLYGFYRFI